MLLISSDLNINNTDLPLKEENISLSIEKVPKRIIYEKINQKYEEQFQELYNTNEEFKNKIDNDVKYRDMLLFKSQSYSFNDYIKILALEFLLYKYKEFKELYNNNKKFKELCDNYEKFKITYGNSTIYRNKINNNLKFLDLQYLIYTDSKFKKLYDSNKDFQNVAGQIYLCTPKHLKIFRPYDSFIEHYYNDKEFQEKINSDREFMIDQIILYSNNDFIDSYYNNKNKQFKNAYDNDEGFRIAYRSSVIFRYHYHKYRNIIKEAGRYKIHHALKYRKRIHDDKEFFKLIVYVTNDPMLYNIYNNDVVFSDLYDNKKTFQKLFLELHQNDLDFKKKYNTDKIFRDNFNESWELREHCKCSCAKT